MAQEVRLMGATYSAVPSILLPDSNSTYHSFVDTSDATASASTIMNGYTAYVGGLLVTGTGTAGTTVTIEGGCTCTDDGDGNITITENGSALQSKSVSYTPSSSSQSATVTADSGYDGLSSVAVTVGAIPSSYIVPSGSLSISSNGTYDVTNYASAVVSASSWTKIAETSYTVSTTSTSAATVGTWSTGNSSLWTSSAFVYVKIRDTSGARSGYFYGSDTFFVNYLPVNGSSTTSLTSGTFGMTYHYSSSGYSSRYNYGTTGYGVYADTIYSDGRIRIRQRYNSSYSTTINGTYSVEVYLLTPPSAIFG